MRYLRCPFAVVLIWALQGLGQANKGPAFADALARARFSFTMHDTTLAGPGAAVLKTAVASSRFVLLGEDHFSQETPRLAASLCDFMHPDAYAVEAGPEAARFFSGLLKSPDRLRLTRERLNRYPSSVAFLDMREENDLAAHCAAASSNPQFAFWGLDQEYVGSAGVLLEDMAATQPGPHSMSAIQSAMQADRAAEKRAQASGKVQHLYLLASPDRSIHSLDIAVREDGNAETKSLIHEFEASRHIYQMQLAGRPDAGILRAHLLKQHFMADYHAFENTSSKPRVFLKFGAMHAGKGFSFIHQRDLGNFICEEADLEDALSLHILVLGIRGAHSYPGPYGKRAAAQAFDLSRDQDWNWLAPALQQVQSESDIANGTTWTLFDLRQLRLGKIGWPPGWEHLVYSYDLLILSSTFTPSHPLD